MIGFDIDGVTAKSGEVLQKYILLETGFDIYNCRNTWEINIPKYQKETIFNLVNRIIDEHSNEINPYPNVIQSFQNLFNIYRQPITFVTARPEFLEKSTREWLTKNLKGIPFNLIMTEEKAEYLKENKFLTFVEDRLKNANLISEYIPSVFLINRAWNQNRPTNWNVIRINNIEEACDRFIHSLKK